MIAGLSPRPASTFLSTQLSAKFRSPPGNQRGHWIPRALSSTRSYGRVQRTPRSRTTASQYYSGSTMLRRWSSSSEPIWWARMKRPMRERSTYSFVGRQTISRLPASVMGSLPTGGVYPEAGRRPTRGIDTGCGLRHELHQQTRDGDQAAADRIGREAETFERVGAEERRRLGRREDEKRDHGAAAHADPALADVVLDAPAVREHEGVANMGRDAEPPEQRRRNGRVGRARVDERLDRLPGLACCVANLDRHTERAHSPRLPGGLIQSNASNSIPASHVPFAERRVADALTCPAKASRRDRRRAPRRRARSARAGGVAGRRSQARGRASAARASRGRPPAREGARAIRSRAARRRRRHSRPPRRDAGRRPRFRRRPAAGPGRG